MEYHERDARVEGEALINYPEGYWHDRAIHKLKVADFWKHMIEVFYEKETKQ